MTARDRTVLIVLGLVAAIAAFWVLAVSPKRKEANDVAAQVTQAQDRLTAAQVSAASAEAARQGYNSDYATVARLGKAVPVDDDVPSLVYQLEHTADDNNIDFRSIKMQGSGSGGTAVASASGSVASSSTPAGQLPPGAEVGTAGFPTMPFSFDFDGKFFPMQHFLHSLDGLTTVNGEGEHKAINVKGRLLTVDGVSLQAGPNGFPDVSATIAATAYLLPDDEGLTNGATPQSPDASSAAATSTTSGAPTPTASLITGDH